MFKKITKEDVEHFLLGSDPMERIIKIEYTDYDSTKVAVFYRDENGKKQILYDDLHPFCWCKTSAAQKLYDGNRQVVKTKLAEYGITCKLLRTKKEDGSEPERMINGYKLLFQSIVPNSYTRFMEFFEKGGVPVYGKNGDKSERNYVCVAPNEQYMIATGRRLFKGYEDYDQLIRLDWDLETTGLDGKKETIDQIGIHTNKGFNKILTTIGDTVEERMSSQYDNMEEMFSIIEEIDPDVMTGYNSENFDWVFVDGQYEKYDTTMTKESAKYLRSGVYKKKKESILKLGGEMERYHQTVMSGVNITDGLHAVRRAMAIDSNIKSATLKNIAKDFKLNPKNRVYVPGNDISDIWNDLNKNYAFNEEDGDWYRYDPNYVKPKVELKKPKFSVKDYELFIEEDKATMARYRAFLQTFDGGNPEECPYCDEFFDFETGEIFDYDREYEDTDTGQSLYDAEEQRLLDEYNEANSFKKGYNGKKFTLYTRNYIAEDYELVTGRYIVERYLMDDLRETDAVELQFNQSNFLISKMLPLSFERACTMGTAGIWKYIMLAFSYENGLAIPEAENAVLSIGGLSRLERTGLCTGVAKLDYNSLYPSICLSFDYKCDVDIADAMHTMLEFVLTQREHFKEEKKKYGKAADKIKTEKEEYIKSLRETDKYKNLDDKEFGKLVGKDKKVIDFNDQYNEQKKLSSKYDKLQLPYKILGNSWFGSVSSNVFFWNSAKVGGLITSTGRMMFRLLTHHFMTMSSRQPVYVKNGECPPLDMNQLYDYQPIVGDTDGINFKIAEKLRYTDEHPYYATGEGRNGKIGKPYTGLAADVQEFEDLYLRRKNGIDIDEVVPSSINYKRKTYSDLLENGSVKLVGNSIKSKKMPVFIEKFLDKAIPLQLYDKGKEFIEFYYDYIEKIYNYKIPLKDIASVGKIKISIDEYKQKCKETTSAGTKKSRQAWYELVIRDGMKVDMGDTIYYINTGNKKTQSDVQRVTKYFVKQSDLFNENGEIDMTKEYERELNRIKKQFKDNPSNPEIAKYLKSNGKVISLSDYVKIEHPEAEERDEILFNCIMLPREIVEDEEDRFCEEGMEYNVEKYIEMLNKRITGLLVCFKRSMRDKVNEKGKTVSNILISNPADRKEFTDEDCQLISGEPMNESDEDKVEDVMMPEDKEIKFWLSINQKPPYIDECGLNWEQIKKDYLERQEILQREGIRDEVEKYRFFIENTLTKAMYDDFIDDGEIPSELSNFLDVETNSMNLISKKYNVVIGSLMDIIDADFSANSWMKNDEEEAPE